MSKKEKMALNGTIVSVELLHELASDSRISDIYLGCTILGMHIKGCRDSRREYSQWELHYTDGNRILVYV